MSAVVVRDARREEFAEFGRLTVAAYSEFADAFGPERWAHYAADLANVEERARHAAIIVAEEGGGLAGAVAFYPSAKGYECGIGVPPGTAPRESSWPPEWASLRALAVHPLRRGRGVGRALVEECIRRAREMGAEALALHTVGPMKAAQAMYEAMGFQRLPAYEYPERGVLAYALVL